MPGSNCCFLTCIHISQEPGQVVCYSHLLKNFPQFAATHKVKGFSVVNEAEAVTFLEISCFFDHPPDVGNLISGSSAFSKCSLYIWKFLVYVLLKPSLKDFEYNFANMWPVFVAQSCPTLYNRWFAACQAPLSMWLPRQGYWSGLPFTSPGDLPDPGIEPGSPALQADSLPTMWNEHSCMVILIFFGIALLWDWNKNWPFPVLWPLMSFPNLLAYWVQHFHSIIF